MPTFAQGSRSELSFITEVTPGTTPVSGNFAKIPTGNFNINLTKEILQSSDLHRDRMPRVSRHGNRSVSGDFSTELRAGDYDALFESVMLSAWDDSPVSLPDTLKVGTTPKYFSMQDYASEIDVARIHEGVTMSSVNISTTTNAMVMATWSVVGLDSAAPTATERTVDDASGNVPFDSYSGSISFGDRGSTSSVDNITNIDFTIENSFSPTFVIGSAVAPTLQYGNSVITGTFSSYFSNTDLLDRFLNETESELEFSVNDPTGNNEYTFLFPYIKINSANVSVAGPESRIVECEFEALYDDTEESSLVIKRPDSS